MNPKVFDVLTQAEEERPPKTQRLSSGSSSCTASLSPDGSTTGRVNALTGASSSSHDHGHGDEDDDDDVVELVVGDHNGDIEEDQEAVDAQRSGNWKGSGFDALVGAIRSTALR